MSESQDPIEALEKRVMDSIAESDPGSPLFVDVNPRDGIPVVVVEGELDVYTAPNFQERVATVLGGSPPGVVFDLSHLSFIDSTGMGVFLRASRDLPGKVAVAGPSGRIERLFRAVGLAERLSLHRTVAEALQHLKQPAA